MATPAAVSDEPFHGGTGKGDEGHKSATGAASVGADAAGGPVERAAPAPVEHTEDVRAPGVASGADDQRHVGAGDVRALEARAPEARHAREARAGRTLADVGREVVPIRDFSERFPKLAPLFADHARANAAASGNVHVIGVLELLVGEVRRSDPALPAQSRSDRGGSRGGAVERLSRRSGELQAEASDLRQQNAFLRNSLKDVQQRLDAVTAERDRAHDDARRAHQRLDAVAA